jgi:hypothetical protein
VHVNTQPQGASLVRGVDPNHKINTPYGVVFNTTRIKNISHLLIMDPGYPHGFGRIWSTAKQNSDAENLANASVHSPYAAEFQLALHDSVEPIYWSQNAQYSRPSPLAASENIISHRAESNEGKPILSLEQALDKSPHSAIWRAYLAVMPPALRYKMEIELREDPMKDEAFLRASCDEFWRQTYHSQEHIDHLNRQSSAQRKKQQRQHEYYHDRVPQRNQRKGVQQQQQFTVAANQTYYHHRQAANDEQGMSANQTTEFFGQVPQQQQQQHYYHSREPVQSATVAANQSYYHHRQAANNEQDMPANEADMRQAANSDHLNNYYHNRNFRR